MRQGVSGDRCARRRGEVDGTVLAVGDGVTGFSPGDGVFGGCPGMLGGWAPMTQV